jgi:hypothetical protein
MFFSWRLTLQPQSKGETFLELSTFAIVDNMYIVYLVNPTIIKHFVIYLAWVKKPLYSPENAKFAPCIISTAHECLNVAGRVSPAYKKGYSGRSLINKYRSYTAYMGI